MSGQQVTDNSGQAVTDSSDAPVTDSSQNPPGPPVTDNNGDTITDSSGGIVYSSALPTVIQEDIYFDDLESDEVFVIYDGYINKNDRASFLDAEMQDDGIDDDDVTLFDESRPIAESVRLASFLDVDFIDDGIDDDDLILQESGPVVAEIVPPILPGLQFQDTDWIDDGLDDDIFEASHPVVISPTSVQLQDDNWQIEYAQYEDDDDIVSLSSEGPVTIPSDIEVVYAPLRLTTVTAIQRVNAIASGVRPYLKNHRIKHWGTAPVVTTSPVTDSDGGTVTDSDGGTVYSKS